VVEKAKVAKGAVAFLAVRKLLKAIVSVSTLIAVAKVLRRPAR